MRESARSRAVEPAEAYDLWAATYDDQPGNLILHLDEVVFSHLLAKVDLHTKAVLDIGCGTGRHWAQVLERRPASLAGCDVSSEMLKRLRLKFPGANAQLLRDSALLEASASIDVVLSTLAIAHVADLSGMFSEWDRILKSQGEIILTDFHPAALEKGADRTFRHNGELISIKSHIHSLEKIRRLARDLNWNEAEFMELKIDETVKHYYAEQNALPAYERFRNTPIIYGFRLKKA